LWHGLRELLAYEVVNGGQVSIITRLDRETSGLTLVAKTKEMARLFCTQMERRVAEKEYLAIVWAWPASDEFTIDAPLLRQGKRTPSPIYLKQMAHADGAVAQTLFRVERRFTRTTTNGERFSLVRAFPTTGRTHQIRVHLALAGHPIVGDKIYGPDQRCYLDFIATGWTPALAERLLLPRHALHAARFGLPELGHAWQSPLPPDLASWLPEL
jgi:23S rRNA pseudouridine1911/1915/1917 synthase